MREMTPDLFTEADCDCAKATLYYPGTQIESGARTNAISLDKANALVRERTKTWYGRIDSVGNPYNLTNTKYSTDTHLIRTVSIEPLAVDSYEQLAKDFMRRFCKRAPGDQLLVGDLYDRARKLLEAK